jgi:chloramphenicol O-acetyltransferase type B
MKKPTGLGFLRTLRMQFLLRLRYRFKSVGTGLYIGRNCYIRPYSVRVGSYSFIGSHCHLSAEVDIGNWVMLASFVSIVGGDHQFSKVGTPMIWSGRSIQKKVRIEDDVWIGHGATLLHGVTVGRGAVVGASSLITKDVPAFSIVGGIPAKVLRMRFNERDRLIHSEMLDTMIGSTMPRKA